MIELYKKSYTGYSLGDLQSQNVENSADLSSNLNQTTTADKENFFTSEDFKTGVSGWKISPRGDVEFNSGTFRGSLVAGQIHIPDTTTANSFHANTAGDTWWGANLADFTANNENATAYVLKTGAAKFTDITITGGTVKYGKTSFTDDAHSGYYLGDEGVYFGDVADATAIKYNIATGVLTIVGGIDITSKLDKVGGAYSSSAAGARVLMFPDASTGIQVIDDGGADVFKVLVGGADVGDVQIGNYSGNQGILYDKSTATFTLKGVVTNLQAGSSLDGQYLSSNSVGSGSVNLALRGWTQTCAFSSTDLDTVSWGVGVFTASDGTSYNISAGNTGNMAARTYIYLDIAVSTTAYQTTTTATTAVGNGKVLIATAINGAASATFEVFGGAGGLFINGDVIAANSIVANQLNVAQLSAISANLGTITAGSITTSSFSIGDTVLFNATSVGSIESAATVQFVAGQELLAGDYVFVADDAVTEVTIEKWFASGTSTSYYNFSQSTTYRKQAQSFVIKGSGTIAVTGFRLKVQPFNYPSNFKVHIYSDSGGNPNVSLGDTGFLGSGYANPNAPDYTKLYFEPPITLTAETTYWIVLEGQILNDSKYYQVAYSVGKYSRGSSKYYDGAAWNDNAGDIIFELFANTVVGKAYRARANSAAYYDTRVGFNSSLAYMGANALIQHDTVFTTTGKTAGAIYYIQDETLANNGCGLVGTVAGTNTVDIGMALSTTKLKIKPR